jgi:hypothetical protein
MRTTWLLLLALPLASAALAQRGVHTPAPGTAERREILDGMRREMRRTDPRPVIFVVRRLRVQGTWAWLEAEPRSPNQAERYEPEAALLRRVRSRWSVVERMPAFGEREGTAEESDCGYFGALRGRFPAAPRTILPLAACHD